MGTRLQNEANAVLNAMDEARVQTVIRLYDSGWLKPLNIPERENARVWSIRYWAIFSGVNANDVSYWLDYLGVTQ